MRVSTTAPLEDNERSIFLNGVRSIPSRDARTAWFFFSFPVHPDVLIHPDRARLRLNLKEWVLVWHRPKTGVQILFPVASEIQSWLPSFIEGECKHSGMEYVRRVRRFGIRRQGGLRERFQR